MGLMAEDSRTDFASGVTRSQKAALAAQVLGRVPSADSPRRSMRLQLESSSEPAVALNHGPGSGPVGADCLASHQSGLGYGEASSLKA